MLKTEKCHVYIILMMPTCEKQGLNSAEDKRFMVCVCFCADADGYEDEDGVYRDGVVPQHGHDKCK